MRHAASFSPSNLFELQFRKTGTDPALHISNTKTLSLPLEKEEKEEEEEQQKIDKKMGKKMIVQGGWKRLKCGVIHVIAK